MDEWTGQIVGWMHVSGVTGKALAREVGWHPKYLSAVLNGRRKPKKAQQLLQAGMLRIEIKRRQVSCGESDDLSVLFSRLQRECPSYAECLMKKCGFTEGE